MGRSAWVAMAILTLMLAAYLGAVVSTDYGGMCPPGTRDCGNGLCLPEC